MEKNFCIEKLQNKLQNEDNKFTNFQGIMELSNINKTLQHSEVNLHENYE